MDKDLIKHILVIVFVVSLMPYALMALVKKRTSDTVLNMALVICALIFFFCVAEVVCMFFPISHSVGYTLGSGLWFKKYWKPINKLGFRDYEITNEDMAKKKIFVMGDSMAAGHGIKNIEERFSNILQKKLGPDVRVFNMGKNGMDTLGEIEQLKRFPYKPDMIILSYYPNDIEDRAIMSGIKFIGFEPYKDMNPFVKLIIKKSYFINFLYWSFPRADVEVYFDFLKTSYANKAVIEAHLNDLRYFIDYSREKNIPLYIVIFPFLGDLVGSSSLLKPIEEFFSRNNISIIKVADLAANMPPNQLIINKNDQHPNEWVNHRVADELIMKLKNG